MSADPFCLVCGAEVQLTTEGWAAYRRGPDVAHLAPTQCAEAPGFGPHIVKALLLDADTEQP